MSKASRAVLATSTVAGLGLTLLAAVPVAAAPAPGADRAPAARAAERLPVDVSGVTVKNTAKKVTMKFRYHHTMPQVGVGEYPYWWGATIYVDTNPRTKIPDYAAFLTNQCGSGYAIGKVVRKYDEYTDKHFLTISDRWLSGCADAPSCADTAQVNYGPDNASVTSISFRRRRGCFTDRRVRVGALFQTGPYGIASSEDDWADSYDKVDLFPKRSLTSYTGWTAPGRTNRFTDRSAGFGRRGPSMAP